MPDLIGSLIHFEFEWEAYKIQMILTKPVIGGRKTYLTKRTCHAFTNDRPCELQTKIKSVFFEIYQEFKVAQRSMPFVIIHFITTDLDSFDLNLGLDIRHVNFSPKWQADLWCELRERIKTAFFDELQNSTEGKGLGREDIMRKMAEDPRYPM